MFKMSQTTRADRDEGDRVALELSRLILRDDKADNREAWAEMVLHTYTAGRRTVGTGKVDVTWIRWAHGRDHQG